MRILRKEPDLIEHMSDRITSLLKDRAHGVILTTLQLIIEIIDLLPDTLVEYVKLVPSLVRLLRYTHMKIMHSILYIYIYYTYTHYTYTISTIYIRVHILFILYVYYTHCTYI